MIWLWSVGGAFAAYALFVRWLIFWRGDFREVYSPWIAKLLVWRGMQAITLGPTCYKYSPDVMLTEKGRKHERFHYEEQQRQHWLIFFPAYLYQLARFGYDKMPIEQDARAAAGDPLR